MQRVAEFAIEHVSYLGPDKPNPAIPDGVIEQDTLCEIYRQMLRTRLFDKKAIALQRTGNMGTYPPINGQEAISASVGMAMQEEDILVPYYRDYGAQFQRGVRMSDILNYWGGDEQGSNFSNKQDLPNSVPIASQCLHAAGVAFAFKYRNQPRVAVVSIGDGGTSEGDFYEAINVAGAWQLPVVFIINNNQWAISVPLSQQTKCQTLAQKGIAAGVEGVQCDGNDAIACYDVVRKAIDKARAGKGPTIIEALTYRLCDHTTADDATRYQPANEVKIASAQEPLARLKQFLIDKQWWSEEQDKDWEKSCKQEIEEEVTYYQALKKPPITAMFDYMYESLPDYLLEQRAIAMEEEEDA